MRHKHQIYLISDTTRETLNRIFRALIIKNFDIKKKKKNENNFSF
jgi:regulator of PEP synthase PpsR (kinase-PPPase family)